MLFWPLLAVLLLAECRLADLLVSWVLPGRRHSLWLRATADSLGHGVIAASCWLPVCCDAKLPRASRIVGLAACFLLGSGIDVDHFLAAGSLSLQDALNLSSRPALHCSSLLAVGFVLVLLASHVPLAFAPPPALPWQLLVAGLSHHLRDGNRRGLWFYPFGSTPPVPFWLYVSLVWLTAVAGYYGYKLSVFDRLSTTHFPEHPYHQLPLEMVDNGAGLV